jgi:hypothetical protein
MNSLELYCFNSPPSWGSLPAGRQGAGSGVLMIRELTDEKGLSNHPPLLF